MASSKQWRALSTNRSCDTLGDPLYTVDRLKDMIMPGRGDVHSKDIEKRLVALR